MHGRLSDKTDRHRGAWGVGRHGPCSRCEPALQLGLLHTAESPDHTGVTFVAINSGKLYGPARRRAPAGPSLTREDKDRRIRDHVRSVAAALPTMLRQAESALPNGRDILAYVGNI